MDERAGDVDHSEETPTFMVAQQEWIERLISSKLDTAKDPSEEPSPAASGATSHTSPAIVSTSGARSGKVTGKSVLNSVN